MGDPEFWEMDHHRGTKSPWLLQEWVCLAWQPCWLVLDLPALFSLQHVVSRDGAGDSSLAFQCWSKALFGDQEPMGSSLPVVMGVGQDSIQHLGTIPTPPGQEAQASLKKERAGALAIG